MRLFKWLAVLSAGIFVAAMCIQACGTSERSDKAELTGEMAEGRDAAQRYCGTCHLPVAPSLLDKSTWKSRVLPVMAQQLGMEVWQQNQYFAGEHSAMPITEWMKIVEYYDSLAPVHLPAAKAPLPVQAEWGAFTLKMPTGDSSHLATTTLVAIDSAGRAIYTSSFEAFPLVRWDHDFNPKIAAQLTSPAMHMLFPQHTDARTPVVTAVGEMRPFDVARGALYRMKAPGEYDPLPLITGLRRPLHTSAADVDRDGKTDYVVSAFGHNQGGLYLFRQLQDGKFEKIPLREVAGATQSVTGDFNGDGWTDIAALFAHAQEGIWLFTNDGKGGFSEKPVLRFPPVYGSSSFQIADFNRDGEPDILYTAGDNSDYSRILKPYHGIYIFLNKGNFRFEQSWFYPANGATKAMAADFDGDGSPDIASISFFADLVRNPGEKFLYFKNESAQSGLKFQPFSPPIARYGRWLCMDVNDWDGDGDPDIVLGNYSRGFLNQEAVQADWNVHLPFVVLRNDRKPAPKH
ncbi:MAG: hypothetical protein BGO21_18950 [Dyadobacter sp. 50-39]|uniref:FG-GAP repeat domain-containing protein n=1 Tax=Dyadobacter sp. 50-39 TaxID=1895756 RepID=UPI00095C970E|nr:VCBS repeat-containing protein [Dyadobacter sp. 50-39]OJV14772.1 MAG: hypothetical protein BGO21_18950 [Dyadobacter sp. 50-39]